jgi:hypothetical protein
MTDSYVQRVAGELADLAIADQKASGDIAIIDEIAKIVGASSQTLEEAFLTAVRVRKAEERARNMLLERKANGYAAAPKPPPAPLQGPSDAETEDVEEEPEVTAAPQHDPEAEAEAARQDAIERLKKAGIGMPRRVQR